jgi:Mn2+/Fe2+ NRAMP family transporter
MRLSLPLLLLLLLVAAASVRGIAVHVDAHEEECFFAEATAGARLGLYFQVSFCGSSYGSGVVCGWAAERPRGWGLLAVAPHVFG